VLAARALMAVGPCHSVTDGKRKMVTAVKEVAKQLGNRPATCRKYYIHPAMFDAYAYGSLFTATRQGAEQELAYNGKGLAAEEYAVMVIIAEYLENLTRKADGMAKAKHDEKARAA